MAANLFIPRCQECADSLKKSLFLRQSTNTANAFFFLSLVALGFIILVLAIVLAGAAEQDRFDIHTAFWMIQWSVVPVVGVAFLSWFVRKLLRKRMEHLGWSEYGNFPKGKTPADHPLAAKWKEGTGGGFVLHMVDEIS